MSSVDGARAFHISWDAIISQACDPCNYSGKKTEAINYCENCDEYLCSDCRDNHKGFKAFRNHQIFSLTDVSSMSTLRELTSGTVVTCGCDKNSEATFHCHEHDEVICETCKTSRHRKCKPVPIKEEDTSYAKDNLRSVKQKADELRKKINVRVREKRDELEQLATMKKTCQKEINAFREEVNAIFNSLEDSSNELDELESEQRHEIEEHISVCSATDQMLEADIRFVEKIIKTGENDKIYAANIQISTRLKQHTTSLKDCFERLLKPALTFKRQEELYKALDKASGRLVLEADRSSANKVTENLKGTSFLKLGPETPVRVDIIVPGQKQKSYVSGCAFLPEGELILCDYNNNKVRLFSRSFISKSSLDLKARPWDVSAINNKAAIVTLPEPCQLLFVAVETGLNIGRVIELDKPCWGVDVTGQKIYVTCHNSGIITVDGEIKVLDMEGNLLSALGINADGSFSLQRPYYVSASVTSGKVFFCDIFSGGFTFFNIDGTIAFRGKRVGRGASHVLPRGFCLDGDDNAIVCDNMLGTVRIITAERRVHRTICNIKSPSSVAYRHMDNTIVVGCENQSILFVVKTAY